jgi:hypothetical protein
VPRGRTAQWASGGLALAALVLAWWLALGAP